MFGSFLEFEWALWLQIRLTATSTMGLGPRLRSPTLQINGSTVEKARENSFFFTIVRNLIGLEPRAE